MVNYGNGKIYKIVRLSDDVVVYVGSTTKQYLCSRLVEHKNKATKYPNRRVYKLIADNDGWKNHEIILIELCDCNSKDELHRKEREFIVSLKPIGNIQIPLRTQKEYNNEYRIENREKINEYMKEYKIHNKETLKQNAKQIITCCCGKTYTHQNRVRHNKTEFHLNNITVQFKLITKLHNELQNRPPIPDLSNLLLV